MKKYFCWLFILGLQTVLAQGNIPIGTWRLHAPYNRVTMLADAGNRIYAASSFSLFYFDKTDNSLNPLTTIDGLSGTDVSAIAYDARRNQLVVGYESGNIDFIEANNRITRQNAIARNAMISSSKKINHIHIAGDWAYLSCNFGIVKMFLPRRDIRDENPQIGANGTISIPVYAATTLRDTLYIATSEGIKWIPTRTSTLRDYSLWSSITTTQGLNGNLVTSLATFQQKLYAVVATNTEGCYNFQILQKQDNHQFTNILNNSYCQLGHYAYNTNTLQLSGSGGLTTSDNILSIAINEKEIVQIQADNSFQIIGSEFLKKPFQAIKSGNTWWIADEQLGLMGGNNFNDLQSYKIESPFSSEFFRLYPYQNKMVVLGGGFTASFQGPLGISRYYVLENGKWTNFAPELNNLENELDLVAAAYNPINQHLYLASFHRGIVIKSPDGSTQRYDACSTNPPFRLPAVFPTNCNGYNSTRVGGIAVDNSGFIWITTQTHQAGTPALHRLSPDNQSLQSYTLPFLESGFLNKVIIDANNNKWMVVRPRQSVAWSVMAFKEKQDNTFEFRTFNSGTNTGALPSLAVNDIDLDLNGDIWFATDGGVAVYYNPANIMNQNNYATVKPISDGRPTLEADRVTSIAVDGGNRKWFGTRNGLWLFNENATKPLLNFTTDNSPLPSNNILDIEIQPQTGELFIVTDKGLISYRSNATQGQTECNIKIFPNPVRPEFNGTIGVSGLAERSVVKITDISGKLMYETTSIGGTATWNRRDYNGVTAKSGIYLIWVANSNGENTCISKLALIE